MKLHKLIKYTLFFNHKFFGIFFSHKKYMKALVQSVENIEMWCKVEDES